MKFYDRKQEIELLSKIEKKSYQNAQMTFVVGRRRIGKTSLLIKANEDNNTLYFFVVKKNEAFLCQDFAEEIELKLGVKIYGNVKTFKDIFSYLMDISKTRQFTLIIDEFQDFTSVNFSIYAEMQNIWDKNKNESKINLILCGSVYSLMKKIFENSKEPLFGRATSRIYLKSFDLNTIKEILGDYNKNYTSEDLLAFYLVSGGVAKYIELLIDAGAFTFEKIIDEFFSNNSLFLDEGKIMLIDEFGKDYSNYFSILSLISSSKTSRTEMESIMEMQIGGYLDRLENDFGLITKVRPMFSKPGGRNVKYMISDNFLNFWFRFVYKYRGAIETGKIDKLKEIVRRDYSTYSGKILERYFVEKLIMENDITSIGSYWEKGNQNEIDIIAVNEFDKEVIIAEVKRNKEKINLFELKNKSQNLTQNLSTYKIQYLALSMEDM